MLAGRAWTAGAEVLDGVELEARIAATDDSNALVLVHVEDDELHGVTRGPS